jgi:hypothetical protein
MRPRPLVRTQVRTAQDEISATAAHWLALDAERFSPDIDTTLGEMDRWTDVRMRRYVPTRHVDGSVEDALPSPGRTNRDRSGRESYRTATRIAPVGKSMRAERNESTDGYNLTN